MQMNARIYEKFCCHRNVQLLLLYFSVVCDFVAVLLTVLPVLLMRNNVCGKIKFVYFTND